MCNYEKCCSIIQITLKSVYFNSVNNFYEIDFHRFDEIEEWENYVGRTKYLK